MKTRLRQDGGGNREAERGCLFYAWLSFEPTARGRRAEAAGGSAWPQPRHPSLGSGPHFAEAHLARPREERTNTVTPLLYPFFFLPAVGAKGSRAQTPKLLLPLTPSQTHHNSMLCSQDLLSPHSGNFEKCQSSRFPPQRFLDSKTYI